MTHPQSALALKALADFWADMGLEEARALNVPRSPPRPAGNTRIGQQPPAQQTGPRPPPKKLSNNPIAEARRLAAAAGTLTELRAAVERFEGCALKKAAKNTVVCDGAFDADVMLIGEAPGGDEDSQGLPFVGRAGKLLDKMLATIGVSRRENLYITNLIYWRPPGNREPSVDEMAMCAPFLMRQIELKKPKLLLTAGKFATCALLNTSDGIMKLRGRKLLYRQDGLPAPVKCIPLLHPAYLLRQPQDKAKAWDDIRTIAALCDELGIKRGAAL